MINKNDRIRLNITDMGTDGEGIGKYYEPSSEKGLTFFVKNALVGDEVLAVVTRMKKGCGYAKVLEILNPSPDRTVPSCPQAERCGGCQIMQLSYDAQLRFKEHKVKSNIEHIAGQHCENFYPIRGMEEKQPVHFRNKMQFPIGRDRQGRVITGFYAGRTHSIISTDDCPVSPEVNKKILEAVRAFAEDRSIPTYNEETGDGLIRHVLIRNAFHTGQIMVCLVINEDILPDSDCLVSTLKAVELPKPWSIESICLNVNREMTNVILGDKVICLSGKAYIEEQIVSGIDGMKPLSFRINPLSFFQTNPVQTSVLYDEALKMADLKGSETVWDLYCGAGTISLFLAQKAGKVYGVEIVPEAIEDAKANAQRNGIDNVRFWCGRSEDIFPEKVEQLETPDIVVLDPPRKGCGRELLDKIMEVGPDRIVYVSCDSATLARDIKVLCQPSQGRYHYSLEKVQAVDMFPHTVHVETVVLMSRKDK